MNAKCKMAVINGLELLFKLKLPFAPKASELPEVIQSWLIALDAKYIDDSDAERITKGFVILSAKANKWVIPSDLIDAAGSRPLPVYERLPPPEPTEAQRAELAKIIAEFQKEAGYIRREKNKDFLKHTGEVL